MPRWLAVSVTGAGARWAQAFAQPEIWIVSSLSGGQMRGDGLGRMACCPDNALDGSRGAPVRRLYIAAPDSLGGPG